MIVISVSVQQTKTQLTTADSFNLTTWTMIGKLVNSFGGYILVDNLLCLLRYYYNIERTATL